MAVKQEQEGKSGVLGWVAPSDLRLVCQLGRWHHGVPSFRAMGPLGCGLCPLSQVERLVIQLS